MQLEIFVSSIEEVMNLIKMKKSNKACSSSEKYLKDKDNIKVQNSTFSECSLRFLSHILKKL